MSAAPEVLLEAAQYVEALPVEATFLVWPSRELRYEVVGDEALAAAVTRYELETRPIRLIRGFSDRPLIKISVIAVGDGGPGAVAGSSLVVSYREWVAQKPPPLDGCAVHTFNSRDTWPGYALVLVDRAKLADPSVDELNHCVFAALDYAAGFSTPDAEFQHRGMPAPNVRGAILDAAYACALEREGAYDEVERTRDGMTPLPDKKCIASKLRAVLP